LVKTNDEGFHQSVTGGEGEADGVALGVLLGVALGVADGDGVADDAEGLGISSGTLYRR